MTSASRMKMFFLRFRSIDVSQVMAAMLFTYWQHGATGFFLHPLTNGAYMSKGDFHTKVLMLNLKGKQSIHIQFCHCMFFVKHTGSVNFIDEN